MRVIYDPEAGSLQVTFRFYESRDETARESTEARISEAYPRRAGDSLAGKCQGYGGVRFNGAIVTIGGYDGSLTAESATSPDGREETYTITHPALKGGDYACAEGETYIPDRYGHCTYQCQSISYRYTYDTLDEFYFTGFEPPACNDGVDNDRDGRTDYDYGQEYGYGDPSCTDYVDASEVSACSDGADNDADGTIDEADAGCSGRRRGADERERLRPTTARRYLRAVVEARFAGGVSHYRRTCARRAPGSFACTLRWSSDVARYRAIGGIWLVEAQPKYGYSVLAKRRKLDCKRRCVRVLKRRGTTTR